MFGHFDSSLGSADLHCLLFLSFVFHWALKFHILCLIDGFALAAVLTAFDDYLAGIEWFHVFLCAILVRIPDGAGSEIVCVKINVRF